MSDLDAKHIGKMAKDLASANAKIGQLEKRVTQLEKLLSGLTHRALMTTPALKKGNRSP